MCTFSSAPIPHYNISQAGVGSSEQDLAENISKLEYQVVLLVLQVHRSEDAGKVGDAPVFITPDEVIGRENQAGFLEYTPMCCSSSVL